MLTYCLSLVGAAVALSLPAGHIENVSRADAARLEQTRFQADTKSAVTQPNMVLALELGRLGDDNRPPPGKFERGGDSNRVFGPMHPSSRFGRYTGRNLGSYTGSGLGSYTGGGLGRSETMGVGQSNGRNGSPR